MQEAQIEKTPEGQVPVGGGWFILNLGEMAWETVPGFGTALGFNAPDADPSQPGIGVHVHVLQPGEANGYYHAEAAQEGFLVLSGECIAVVAEATTYRASPLSFPFWTRRMGYAERSVNLRKRLTRRHGAGSSDREDA